MGQIMKKLKHFSMFLIIFSVFTLTNCSEENNEKTTSSDKPPEIVYKQLSQKDKEFEKIKKLNVKTRSAFTYYYNTKREIKEDGKLSEKVIFNDEGLRVEHLKYFSNGDVNFRWVYDYNSDGVLNKTQTFDGEGKLLHQKFYHYNEAGLEDSVKAVDAEADRKSRIFHYTYDKGNLIERRVHNANDEHLFTETMEYDSVTGFKLREFKTDPNNVMLQTIYAYNDDGNLVETVANFYKFTYEYDENDNVVTEQLFRTDGGRQHKFVFIYQDDGLMSEKIRYDNSERKIFSIKYEYEYK